MQSPTFPPDEDEDEALADEELAVVDEDEELADEDEDEALAVEELLLDDVAAPVFPPAPLVLAELAPGGPPPPDDEPSHGSRPMIWAQAPAPIAIPTTTPIGATLLPRVTYEERAMAGSIPDLAPISAA